MTSKLCLHPTQIGSSSSPIICGSADLLPLITLKTKHQSWSSWTVSALYYNLWANSPCGPACCCPGWRFPREPEEPMTRNSSKRTGGKADRWEHTENVPEPPHLIRHLWPFLPDTELGALQPGGLQKLPDALSLSNLGHGSAQRKQTAAADLEIKD